MEVEKIVHVADKDKLKRIEKKLMKEKKLIQKKHEEESKRIMD